MCSASFSTYCATSPIDHVQDTPSSTLISISAPDAMSRAQVKRKRRQGSLFNGHSASPPVLSSPLIAHTSHGWSSSASHAPSAPVPAEPGRTCFPPKAQSTHSRNVGGRNRPFVRKRSLPVLNLAIGMDDGWAGSVYVIASPEASHKSSSTSESFPLSPSRRIQRLAGSRSPRTPRTPRRPVTARTPYNTTFASFITASSDGRRTAKEDGNTTGANTPDSATFNFIALKQAAAARRAESPTLIRGLDETTSLCYPYSFPSPSSTVTPSTALSQSTSSHLCTARQRPAPIRARRTVHRRRSNSFGVGLARTKVVLIEPRSGSDSLSSSSSDEYDNDSDEEVEVAVVTGGCTYQRSEVRYVNVNVQHNLRTLCRF